MIGAHTLDAADERRVRILKESGFNAIRSAHNPASRSLLRACDRHGVLVMDELTDAWIRPKVAIDYSLDFADWWERDLEALVANDFNHPSVIMYSIGNEIAETATPRGIEINRRLARPHPRARPHPSGHQRHQRLPQPDLAEDEEKLAEKARRARETGENPNKNLIGILNLHHRASSNGCSSASSGSRQSTSAPATRSRTSMSPATTTWSGATSSTRTLHPDRVIVGSETRAAHTVKIWKTIEHLPHVIGDFAWTGWDYIGEAGLATKQYGTTKTQIYHPYPALLAGEPVIDITGHRQTQSHLNEIGWGLAPGRISPWSR